MDSLGRFVKLLADLGSLASVGKKVGTGARVRLSFLQQSPSLSRLPLHLSTTSHHTVSLDHFLPPLFRNLH